MRNRIESNRVRRSGFTLVEIMIVVGIIGMLAVIAIPNYVRGHSTAQRNACLNNLRQIDGAKQQWALENKMAPDADVNEPDILPYLKSNTMPLCPASGKYTLNNLAIAPSCNIPTHRF